MGWSDKPAANRSGVTAWHPTQAGAARRDLPTPGPSGRRGQRNVQASPAQGPRRTRTPPRRDLGKPGARLTKKSRLSVEPSAASKSKVDFRFPGRDHQGSANQSPQTGKHSRDSAPAHSDQRLWGGSGPLAGGGWPRANSAASGH